MVRKILSVITVVAMISSIALTMSGCSGKTSSNSSSSKQQTAVSSSSNSDKKQTVVFWDENAGPERTPYYQKLIENFSKKYPNITIQYVGLPNADALTKINVAIAGNEVPDVSGCPPFWLANLIAKNAVMPLDSYFSQWSESADINETCISNIRTFTSDKKLYMLPNTTNFNPVFWYRIDWFKEAGLSVPNTWDEFFADIAKLTDKTKGRYGFSIRGGSGGPMQLQDFLYGYSGITEPFTKDGKSTINDPKNLEALQKFAAIYNKYTPASDISNGYKEMVAAFDTGTVAIIGHNLGSYMSHLKTLGEGKFAAFMPPKASNGKRVIAGNYPMNGYVIFTQSKAQDAAWDFISFLVSKDSQNYWNQNIAQVPTNVKLSNESWVKNAQHISLAQSTLNESSTIAIPYPIYLPDYQSIQDSVALPGFQAVLAGKEPASQLLDDWANAMTKSYASYNKTAQK